jgi:prevent-host-death family protein
MKRDYQSQSAVGVGELKARLSEYLRRVKRGEEVIVTERGRAVARLSPVIEPGQTDARYHALVASGAIRPPVRKPDPDFFRKRLLPADPEGLALQHLLEEREEGW